MSTDELDPQPLSGELSGEESLRPRRLADYVGQERLKENLGVFIAAARGRDECLDHSLFFGPPGLGKTTLAHIIANEMEAELHVTSGPVLERAGDLAALVTNLGEGDVLFIDEIHRLSPQVEEILYPAMEDFELDLVIGEGPAARSVRLSVPRFCLVGATTRAGLLTAPLRDRFGIVARLDFYPADELAEIVARSARILGIELESETAGEIARRSRGTPRIANRLLRRVRDFAAFRNESAISVATTKWGLERMEVDEFGLDELDRRLLRTIVELYDGGPVGLKALAASLGEDQGTLEDIQEPYLLQIGLLTRTPRGRVATSRAYRHLGLQAPGPSRPLFDGNEEG